MSTVGISPRGNRVFVAAISTSNLTLSGLQTVDTVELGIGMFCAALGQSDNKNSVYIVQSGAWLPADPGIGPGLEVYAVGGSANVNAVYGCDTTGAITWGTTSTTFTKKSSTGGTFNPASPGVIGDGTPAAITGTTITATTQFAGPGTGLTGVPGTAFSLNAFRMACSFGRNGSGSVSLSSPGVAVGDVCVGIVNITDHVTVVPGAAFEATITVQNQIQQLSASDLSAKTLVFFLIQRS